MLLDRNKGITSIEYHHLNLPRRINFASGGNIIYIYNAQGVKLQKTVNNPNSTQASTRYRGGFQYDNTTLQFVHTAEGYIKHTINPFATNPTIGAYHDFDYVYNYTDHLGNIRLSYTLDPATQEIKVMEENHYYPFGLKHTYNLDRRDIGYFDYLLAGTLDPSQDTRRTRMVNNNGYQYKYNGKEWQDELGLNMYDYHARNYDPAIGRWMNIDPLAEEDRKWTPYRYCYNNPLRFTDPDGMSERDELIITGDDAKTVVKELNNDSQLNLIHDEVTGKISIMGPNPDSNTLSQADQNLLTVINSERRVNLSTTKDVVRVDANGNQSLFLFGAYNGQSLTDSYQEVNVGQAQNLEANGGQTAGTTIRHEVFEGFAAMSIVNSINSETPYLLTTPTINVYNQAHNDAINMDSSNYNLQNVKANQFYHQTSPNNVLWMNLNPNANNNSSGWFKL